MFIHKMKSGGRPKAAPSRWLPLSRIWVGAAAALLLSAAPTAKGQQAQQTWSKSAGTNYGQTTRAALTRLLNSAEKLKRGDKSGAQAELAGMASSLGEITKATDFFREQANREFDRCVGHIGTLDKKVGELYQQEIKTAKEIQDLDAKLVNVMKQKQLTDQEISTVNQQIQIAKGQMEERQRKLEELRKWWWVPFYGFGLAIRTLVDDDIGNYNSLTHTLRDSSSKLASHQRDLNSLEQSRNALNRELGDMARTQKALKELRETSEQDLANLKKSAVFLTDAQVFWGKVTSLLKMDVGQSLTALTDIMLLKDLMNKQNAQPSFSDPRQRPITELHDSLITFADTLDQGNNFLMAEGSDFCGGPARQKVGPNVSNNCNIESITRYYEIVDPKTCSFRYLNPPGCPPLPRKVTVTDQAVAASRTKGSWTRSEDQNWVGRSRCESPHAVFYGKMNSADACERTCMSDPNCVAWTYNERNGYMPNSTSECWGATRELQLLKSSWSGFRSGGRSAN
jgi:hypothetical protein